ncbi:hypothetical protein BDV95DRAFT_374275 [Massariosphaeria phaeospora]|uniref:GmrSD restriction endonucleases N-terminal domain-containing protein n=1 Tax=Massariosphaeria phaeospora TaxID=100035 RepID=A0A7C8I892_9PLEO|nr:hypothetical protein BDV95DRAFT_374275 [Massariosphaeria phaeospora]
MRTLAYLIKGLNDGLIDVNPDYQRDVVWTADRMTGLINSLMENFYIPPIILNKKTRAVQDDDDATSNYSLVCVDGKQRLSSVRAFVMGIIPCHDHRGEKWYFCGNSTSKRRKILSEEKQKQFLAKDFVSFEFLDLSPEQEEDLFARVQKGVQLTLAEKMRASTGLWQELARLYVEDFSDVFSLLRDRARAKDFQLALACFSQILEVQHTSTANGVPVLKTNFAALPKLLNNMGAVDDGIKSHLASVFSTFKDLLTQSPDTFTNEDKHLRGVQTFAPIEMIGIVVLISMYSDTRNNRLLLGDISALRTALRENFTDLRMNPQVWKFIWDFIDDLEQIRGAIDGSTIDRSVKPSAHTPKGTKQAPMIAGVKRGRPTAKTKPPTIKPGGSDTIKTEDKPPTLPVEPPPPKRQRVNSSSKKATQRSNTSGVNQLRAGSSTTDPMVLDDDEPEPNFFPPDSLSTPASPASATATINPEEINNVADAKPIPSLPPLTQTPVHSSISKPHRSTSESSIRVKRFSGS